MKKKLTKQVEVKIARINELLSDLRKLGYHLDFVESSHVIVETKALKEEMDRTIRMHHNNVDVDAYVVAALR